jgi:hypothetical protein
VDESRKTRINRDFVEAESNVGQQLKTPKGARRACSQA